MKKTKEFQYRRLFEVIKNRPNCYNRMWELNDLFKAVNRLLPNHLAIPSGQSLSNLILHQSVFKVFRCCSEHNGIKKRYYIFKKTLPV